MSREKNPQEWLRYAEDDRQAARVLLDSEFYEQCVFHCQQAVEKLLKAVIVKETQRKPVHTHDLNALMEKIVSVAISDSIQRSISDVDGYYAGSRYPIDVVDANTFIKPLATSALQSTDEIFTWFLTRISFESE